nr:flagellar biosynthetic protein FliO [Massilia sp. MS-15]
MAEQAAPIPVPAPASQETQPLQPGATTTGRPATAPALTPAPVQRPPAVAMPAGAPSTGSLLQTILALVLVLGLLLGLAWFLKRFAPRAMAGGANVRLVGGLSLGGRERIMVVEVGDQWIVVGASPGRVNALATMPRGEGAALQPPAAGQPAAASFGEWLKNTIDQRNAN